PTLPTAAVRRPAAVRMDASIRTVVVLPLVPVTASHGAPARSRHASSTSLHTGTPAVRAAVSSAADGGQPGDATTRSAAATSRSATAASVASAPTTSASWARASTVTTDAARPDRAATTARPVTPSPATSTRAPSTGPDDPVN